MDTKHHMWVKAEETEEHETEEPLNAQNNVVVLNSDCLEDSDVDVVCGQRVVLSPEQPHEPLDRGFKLFKSLCDVDKLIHSETVSSTEKKSLIGMVMGFVNNWEKIIRPSIQSIDPPPVDTPVDTPSVHPQQPSIQRTDRNAKGPCDSCKRIIVLRTIDRHRLTCGGVGMKFKVCAHCSKQFKTGRTLKQHLRTHNL